MCCLSLKSILFFSGTVILLGFGVAGIWFHIPPFEKYGELFLAGGIYMVLNALLETTFVRKDTKWKHRSNEPKKLRFEWIDNVKAQISWMNAFKRTYAIEPGLYYTGNSYDIDAPLLVTANYQMTVLRVYKKVRKFNVRILVIDTDGINVWCSAGKGRFSNIEIMKQIIRYDWNILTKEKTLKIILPKLAFSGVDFTGLRKFNLDPVVGPIHARNLPEYLANPPYEDRIEDRFEFDLSERIFTWLPGLVQTFGYAFAVLFLLWIIEIIVKIPVDFGILILTAWIATAYPILFPWIPGRQFAIKGIWLAGITSLVLVSAALISGNRIENSIVPILFTIATSLFFALSYTGNSPVSNYSRVRKEIARYLIPTVVIYLLCLVFYASSGIS